MDNSTQKQHDAANMLLLGVLTMRIRALTHACVTMRIDRADNTRFRMLVP